MPRKTTKKITIEEQKIREAEALNSTVNLSGQGEDPAVQALLSPEFEQMSNLDASSIALMLQHIVRGQESLLAQARDNSIEIARLRERQDKADEQIAKQIADQQKFIEETLDQAEKLRRTGLENDKLIAQGVQQYQQARELAVAKAAANNLRYEQQLAAEEKVAYTSPGKLVTTMQHGQQVAKIIPEEVHIKNKHWVLPPGKVVYIPKSIKEFLDRRHQSEEETAQRAELLSKNLESNKLAEEWNKIQGSSGDAMPT